MSNLAKNANRIVREVNNLIDAVEEAQTLDWSDEEVVAGFCMTQAIRFAHLRYAIDIGALEEATLKKMLAHEPELWDTYLSYQNGDDGVFNAYLKGLHEGEAQKAGWQNLVEMDVVE